MNYQFIHDFLNRPIAKFDMGYEAFSLWFSEELGSDSEKLGAIEQAIAKVQNQQSKECVIQGDEMYLLITGEDVVVRAKSLDSDVQDVFPEGTELYEQESMAECGLEDFIQVFASWKEFVGE